jgi:hypothetical protein
MIMKTLKDTEPKISGLWNKNLLINPEEIDSQGQSGTGS